MDHQEDFDSDSSDEDYIPDSKAEEVVSEVESDGDPEEPGSGSDEQLKNNGRKRTKKASRTKKKKTKLKENNLESDEVKIEKSIQSEEEKKKNVDDLWADFMKDTGFRPKNSKDCSSSTIQQSSNKPKAEKKENVTEKLPSKIKVTQIFEFAGEEVKVEKEIDANSAEARILSEEPAETSKPRKTGGLSGIGGVLSQLGKKQKISTLEKTKLDWDRFKKDENIEEELQVHNKGKDGYLERQDFLQRADLRRFEIEKNIRNVERAKRFNSAL